MRYAALLVVLTANPVFADSATIGPLGINSKATGLTGDKIEIGQIESGRPGKPFLGIPPEDSASNTNPYQVFFRTSPASAGEAVEEHATLVAGMMIGDTTAGNLYEGVAPMARLYSAAIGLSINEELPADAVEIFALTADRLARISGPDPLEPEHDRRMRAINLSMIIRAELTEDVNGNSHVTLFVDWSARQH